MPANQPAVTADFFTKDPQVLVCLQQLQKKFGPNGEKLLISDVIDNDGHQYANLVQKGGGVLGVALVGYTYILEQMNIRFIRLAGTSAGAINTALMAVIGDKKKAKSEDILKIICGLNFFDLVDGHPAARWLIKNFITNADFTGKVRKYVTAILVILAALPLLTFISFGLQHLFPLAGLATKALFMLTGFFVLAVSAMGAYLAYLVTRLKDSGFGISPGDFFYSWLKQQMADNGVDTVSDLVNKASTPVDGIRLREHVEGNLAGLNGDVTFITSELVTQNKIEFPRMWPLFKKDMNELHPAGFVRASMSIPVFFESYFIDEIPCTDEGIKKAWAELGEQDPPSTARFVDGGILSNFPINLFYNPDVIIPRLPSLGIDLDDTKAPDDAPPTPDGTDDAGKHADKWSLGGYVSRLFNTVRFYYDKDFLIKNAFFKKGIGAIPLKGYNWLNFFLDDNTKREMFILGAKAATEFLLHFDWESYKEARVVMQKNLTVKS